MDPTRPDPESLLSHLPFVRGLAHALMTEPASADDLVQDVALAALQRPPPSGPTRPWLAGVTRNLASFFGRSEERRHRRELAAARSERLPSSHEDAARLESLRRLVAALERIDPADRALVMRRYYDGWPPRRIAAEAGVPVNTVRSRIQRALERMRRELGVTDERERARLLAPLLVVAGGMALGKLKFAAVALVVVAIGLAAARGLGVPSAGSPHVGTTAAAPVAAATERELAAPQRSIDPPPTLPPAEPSPASRARRTVMLSGRLVADAALLLRWSTPLEVVGSVQVVESGRIATPRVPERFTRTLAVAADGSFAATFELDAQSPPIRRLTLAGRDPRFVAFERKLALPGEVASADEVPWSLEIPVFAVATVTGCVVDASGRPVGGAAVAVFSRGADATCFGEALADERGEFALAVAGSGPCQVVATQPRLGPEMSWIDRGIPAPQRLLPACVEVEVPACGEVDSGDLVLREGAAVAGHVEWLGRGPAAGAVVRAIRIRGEKPVPTLRATRIRDVVADTGEPRSCATIADAHGDFEVVGLVPGAWTLQVENLAEGSLAPTLRDATRVRVEAPARDVELKLEAALVEFECRSNGRPVAGVDVTSETPDGGLRAFRGGSWDTDEQGRTGIVLPPEFTAFWWANGAGLRAQRRCTTPAAGESLRVPIELTAPTTKRSLEVRLRGPRGESIPRAGFGFTRPGEELTHERDELAVDGWFHIQDLERGRHHVVIRPGGAWLAGDGCYAEIETDVEVGESGVPRLELDARLAARLRISAQDTGGNFLPAHFTLRTAAGEVLHVMTSHLTEDDRGRFASCESDTEALSTEGDCVCDPALPAGDYVARFELRGFETLELPVHLEEGRSRELAVVMHPTP
jgi:RNA polymerase sigma factor (sigma-70 family)